MFIISNHLTEHNFLINEDYVIRINLAWIRTIKELEKILKKTKNNIFIDYPSGRKKPPDYGLCRFEGLNAIINKCKNVKYYAISNVESREKLLREQTYLRNDIKIVPKIETVIGVNNITDICKGITDMIVLDKEDLYTNCFGNAEKYSQLLDTVRDTCYNNNIKLLELQGVVFAPEEYHGLAKRSKR